MGTVGLQLETALRCKIGASEKPGVRLPNGSCSPLLGHTILHHGGRAYSDHTSGYLLVNFLPAFRAVLDPDTDKLFCKEAEAYIELEVASLTTDPIAVSAKGANATSDLQRERLKAKAERRPPAVHATTICRKTMAGLSWRYNWTAASHLKRLRVYWYFEYLVLQDLCTRWVEASPIRRWTQRRW